MACLAILNIRKGRVLPSSQQRDFLLDPLQFPTPSGWSPPDTTVYTYYYPNVFILDMKSFRYFKLRPLAVAINRPKNLNPSTTRPIILGSASATSKQGKQHEILLERQILNPERAETCQSGTDDEVARHKSPYDSSKTTVESEVQALREEYELEGDENDPLLVSPANQQASRILDPMADDPVHRAQVLGSVKGWTNKNKKVLLWKEPYVFKAHKGV